MMTSSTIVASSVGLLSRSENPTQPVTHSYSKRFYTFFHYEHSTHFRLYVILFCIIIIVTLSLGWLISGLSRLRQTASYSESCAAGKVRCRTGVNLICDLSQSICLCKDGTYWSSSSNRCLSVKGKDSSCESYEQCDSEIGLTCHSNGTCQCPANTYYNGQQCIIYLSYGSTCSLSSSPGCNERIGLICSNTTLTCDCPTSTFWNQAVCQVAASYGEYCSQNITCNEKVGLYCRTSSADPPCDCPNLSKLYTCDCFNGYAWTTSSNSSAMSTCIQQNTYLTSCTSDSQCPQSKNLYCIAGFCNCLTPFTFWSTIQDQCAPCESQGYTLIYYHSGPICTRFINDSLMSYTMSLTTCSSVGWYLISPVTAADLTSISQNYPTYRLWVNIQTSLNSTVYSNNIFPTNQSNWNSYVITSTTSSYNTYTYALQLIPPYNSSFMFEGNIALDTGHALCMLY